MQDTYHYISRSEYNRLIETHPEWMSQNWTRLERNWFVDGVYVTGKAKLMAELLAL